MKKVMMGIVFGFALTSFADGNDQELEKMNQMISEARAVPVMNGRQLEGYRKVSPSKDVAYERLELKQGEAITAPNTGN